MRRWLPILLALTLPGVARAQGRTGGSTQAQQAIQKADEAFAAKRMNEAIQLYLQALSYDRSLTTAYEKLAIAYYAKRRYSEAVRQLEQCLQVSPRASKCHLWLGLHKIKLKQQAAGIAHLQDAIKINWRQPLAMRQLAMHYYRQGDWKRTERACWTFLTYRDKDWPRQMDFPIHVLLGRAYLQMEKYPEAQAQFSAALKINGRHAGAKLGLADAYVGRKYWNDALNLYLSLKDLWAKRPQIHFNLAQCFYRLRRKDKALEHLQQYRANRPRDVAATILQGDIHFFFREYGPALAAYKNATRQDPSSVPAQIKYAEALLETKKADRAYQILQAAQQKQPNHPKLLVALGKALLQLKRPAEAAKAFDKLLTVRPDYADGYALRGEAHLAAKNLPKAVADFKRARQLDPKDWRAKAGLIKVLNLFAYEQLKQNQADQAIATLSEAFGLDPQRIFTNINLGIAYLQAKKHKEALRHLTDVQQRLPRNFAANRLLGRLYYETGQLTAARGHYLQARTVSRRLASRSQAEVEIELGALLAAQNEIDSAVDVLKSAVSNAAGTADLTALAQGNLAIALLDRGYRRLEAGKGAEALADLELAQQYEKQLKGNQPALLRFLLAMAYLEAGNWTKAAAAFQKVTGRNILAQVLNPPYDRLGVKYFQAYTLYRQGGYEAAANAMQRMMRGAPPAIRGRLRDIIRSAYEHRAAQHVQKGKHGPAQKLFKQARTYGLSQPAQLNLAVSLYRSGKQGQALALWQAGGMPATALCNVGTHYDNSGNPKMAYDFYQRCKARGGAGRDVVQRIETIKRIFGY